MLRLMARPFSRCEQRRNAIGLDAKAGQRRLVLQHLPCDVLQPDVFPEERRRLAARPTEKILQKATLAIEIGQRVDMAPGRDGDFGGSEGAMHHGHHVRMRCSRAFLPSRQGST